MENNTNTSANVEVSFYPYDNKKAFMNEMRKYYENRTFKFGYGGFLNHIHKNSDIEIDKDTTNPIYKIMFDLADDLNTEAEPIKLKWDEFYQDIRNEKYDTIADPIISTYSRRFSIIPYSILDSGKIIYHQDQDYNVKTYLHAIKIIRKTHKIFSAYRIPSEIKDQLFALQERTSGFAVREGFLEWDILELADIEPEIGPNGNSFESYAVQAIKKGKILFLDLNSYKEIQQHIDQSQLSDFRDASLFSSPIHTLAGFPVKLGNKRLNRYLTYHFFYKDGIIRKSLNSLKKETLEKFQEFGIYMPPFDTIHFSLVGLTNSPSICNGRSYIYDISSIVKGYQKDKDTYSFHSLLFEHIQWPSTGLLKEAPKKALARNLGFYFMLFFSVILTISLPLMNFILKLPIFLSFLSWLAFFGLSYEFIILFPKIKKILNRQIKQ